MPELPFNITFQPGSVPMWGTFTLMLLGLLTRFTPIWKKLMMTQHDKLVSDLRVEVGDAKKDCAEIKAGFAQLAAQCTAATVRVSQLEFSIALAIDELERVAPDSKVPAQIRSYLAAAMPNPLPTGISQGTMDQLRGTNNG